ncbi:glycoside hydrolase family 3 C-terminal domain-containing protein [Ruania suaedae]|uniref:glycoside hydrolase family 3 protein n=1 Tax=Ruania suaedae TaxID=2897774 RepID=UPI001E2B41AD|nr:glycoside hydrolase family 3 N-terminal domain-containing protein [Ruania suaedae]UFU03591.1 glycoside hydrolase family 3 C-terminal domain-containing protein [Ruania suaedae]
MTGPASGVDAHSPAVADALAGLSRTERIGQLNQRLKGWDALHVIDGRFVLTDTLKREVDRWGGLGALYGLQRADPWSGVHWGNGIPPERSAEAYALVQDYVRSHGNGTPVLFVEEAPHGLQGLGGTLLPVNLAQGASWDVDLVAELAGQVAAELRARGVHVALLSGLDMLRDPRWGRAEECFSEDATLSSALMGATVRAMQGTGRIDSAHVGVVVKHLAAQGAGIGGRNGSGAPIGRRELAEVHLPVAHRAASEGVLGYMAAYNDVDGVPCAGSHALLTQVLRQAWGWQGIVMADGTAIDRLLGATPDLPSAAALALRAGVDLSLWDEAYTQLDEALERGLIEDADLDRAAARVLGAKERLGLLQESARPDDAAPDPPPGADRDRIDLLVRRLTTESMVLLHDESAVLPLRPGRLAVVGPNAHALDAQLGDYTAPRPDPDPGSSTILEGLTERFGDVVHEPGSLLRDPLPGGLDRVRTAAAGADACVVVLGGSSRRLYESDFEGNGAARSVDRGMTSGEGVDLADVELDPTQLDVVAAAREAGRPVVGVLLTGRPHAVGRLWELCDALVLMPFPGRHAGEALAGLLAGDEDFSGALPVSMPTASGVFPLAHDERCETSRGYADVTEPRAVLLGHRAPDATRIDLAPGETAIGRQALAGGRTVEVTAEVRNDGARTRRVVVPLYGRRLRLGVRPRARQVLDLASVEVPAGERRTVTFRLGLEALGGRDEDGGPVALAQTVLCWTDGVRTPGEHVHRIEIEEGR